MALAEKFVPNWWIEPTIHSQQALILCLPSRQNRFQSIKTDLSSEPSMVEALELVPDHDEIFRNAIESHGTVVLGLAPNNNGYKEFDQMKSGLVVQGDDPKQFLNQYIGVENNIEILEEVSSGLGSMSIATTMQCQDDPNF